MKKLFLPLVFAAMLVALYEQSTAKPNRYIMIVAIAIAMFGVLRLSAKLPSKHENKEDDDTQ
jgi:hypothetical protein